MPQSETSSKVNLAMWQSGDPFFFWRVVAILTCLKTLLMPAYHSTDFEVHRNWLAITHSLPFSQWYKANQSQWTLDYPPLFAWMEKGLSYPATLFDRKMLDVNNLGYASQATITYQRLTVILTEMVYVYAVFSFMKMFKRQKSGIPHISLAIIFLCNFGLFLVDHVHFQYNGILFGILLLSILKIYQEKFIEAAFWFSVLLCMKHIFLYIAPVFGIYLLRKSIFNKKGERYSFAAIISRLASLGVVVLGVFSIAFVPFVLTGQISDIISRLFPFKRGLCHAYWAPNFWAIYNVLDKMLVVSARCLGMSPDSHTRASMTGGLVQEFEHVYLPPVKPVHTFLITAAFMLPALKIAWRQEQDAKSFVRALVLCGYSSFMFGWHVHEKAILIMTVPLALLAFDSKRDSKNYLFLTCVANFSLLPLIFTKQEMFLKYILCFMNVVLCFHLIANHHKISERSTTRIPLMMSLESAYLIGLPFFESYSAFIHGLLFGSALPFLPLLLISFYSSIGMMYIYLRMLLSH